MTLRIGRHLPFRWLSMSNVGSGSPNQWPPANSGSVEDVLSSYLADALPIKCHKCPIVVLWYGKCGPALHKTTSSRLPWNCALLQVYEPVPRVTASVWTSDGMLVPFYEWIRRRVNWITSQRLSVFCGHHIPSDAPHIRSFDWMFETSSPLWFVQSGSKRPRGTIHLMDSEWSRSGVWRSWYSWKTVQ